MTSISVSHTEQRRGAGHMGCRWRQQLSELRQWSCDFSLCLEQGTSATGLSASSSNLWTSSKFSPGRYTASSSLLSFFFYNFTPCRQGARASQLYCRSMKPSWRIRRCVCGPSEWMFLVLCRHFHVLAGSLWDELCPLRWGWMKMDLTQIWPQPGKDRQLKWRAAHKSVLQLLVTDGAIICKRSVVYICVINRLWLGCLCFCLFVEFWD